MARSAYLIDLYPAMSRIIKPLWVSEDVWFSAWEDWLINGGFFHYGGLCVKDNQMQMHPNWSIGEYRDFWEARLIISRESSYLDSRLFYQRYIIERELGRECVVELRKYTAVVVFE